MPKKAFTDIDPTWITSQIKNKTQLKSKFYQHFLRNMMRIEDLAKVDNLIIKLAI